MLHKVWDELVTQMRTTADWELVADMLIDKSVSMDGDDVIVIKAANNQFATNFKPYQVKVLDWLRRRTGIQNLTCRVDVVSVQHDTLIYIPDDKYTEMVKQNPSLAELRKLFPDLDY